MTECCRVSSTGEDKKLFDDLRSVLDRLELRPSDKVMMDESVSTKLAVYRRLIAESNRISSLLGL